VIARSKHPKPPTDGLRRSGAVFKWYLAEEDLMKRFELTGNPARDLDSYKSNGEGFHTWTLEEVEQYEARHPLGTMARTALALVMFVGVRRSDVIKLGPQHRKLRADLETGIVSPWHIFSVTKGHSRKLVELHLPVLPQL
jgi:hypothetical protein